MKTEQMVTSAALYFASEQDMPVPLAWFERTRHAFKEHNLPATFFSACDGGFLIDECQLLADRDSDLVTALRNGAIRSLSIDSPRTPSSPHSDWQTKTSIWTRNNLVYFGVCEKLFSPTDLLRLVFEIGRGIVDVRYGIAYKMSLAHSPSSYAFGGTPYTLSEFTKVFEAKRKGTYRKTPAELWSEELTGRKRHLSGFFGGAFPASILSDAHVSAIDLKSHAIGKLSSLATSLWLWELSDSEMPVAAKILQEAGVLVTGTDRW